MPSFRAVRRGFFCYRMMATMTPLHPQRFPQVLWMGTGDGLCGQERARNSRRHWPFARNGLHWGSCRTGQQARRAGPGRPAAQQRLPVSAGGKRRGRRKDIGTEGKRG